MEAVYNNNILKLLKENSPISYAFALKINADNNKGIVRYGNLELLMEERVRKSLLSIIFKNISKEDSFKLRKIFDELESEQKWLELKTGWTLYEDSCSLSENYINSEDPEFATHDTYTISRGKDGYYVNDENIEYNDYFKMIYYRSCQFLEKNQAFFENYHNLLNERENILSGNFTVSNNTISKEQLLEISELLGYKSKENSITR